MGTKIFLFEDHKHRDFYPLTYNRPVCELLSGIMKLREKVALYFPEAEIRILCREFLEPLFELKTNLKVNDFNVSDQDRILLLNGRVVADSSLPSKFDLNQEKSFWHDGELAAVTLTPESFRKNSEILKSLPENLPAHLFLKNSAEEEIGVKLVNYLWDLMTGNPEEILKDFETLRDRLDFKNMFRQSQVDQQSVIYNLDNVYLGENVKIEAFAVLKAEKGPVFIDDECFIQAFSRIEGPAFLGKKTQVFGAKISEGSSFGPVCRLGGEIQQSIIQGYSNKYHEGFIGHSYLGEWVNLGAGTFNSDLKNNYSRIKVNLPHKPVETGLNKVGSFMGDHVKTGIGTLLNTGAYLGLGSNIFGGGMIRAKFIPAFAWGSTAGLHEYAWDKFIESTRIVMQRRGVELSASEEEVLEKVFELTRAEREALKPA